MLGEAPLCPPGCDCSASLGELGEGHGQFLSDLLQVCAFRRPVVAVGFQPEDGEGAEALAREGDRDRKGDVRVGRYMPLIRSGGSGSTRTAGFPEVSARAEA
ncbi:hypothetical protein GCM10022206_03200 [Streptomyces chiangmaiensis]